MKKANLIVLLAQLLETIAAYAHVQSTECPSLAFAVGNSSINAYAWDDVEIEDDEDTEDDDDDLFDIDDNDDYDDEDDDIADDDF